MKRQLFFFLLAILSMVAVRLGAQTCQADFHFAYLNEHIVILYPLEGNYTSIDWTVDGETTMGEPGVAHLFFTQQDTVLVCMTVSGADGCFDTQCYDIYIDSPQGLCHTTDCVWPGDANGNGKANNYDLLNIGLGFNATGPARTIFPEPSNPNAWAPNFADDWGSLYNLPDFKHLDCDGNGVVNAADVQAIYLNYTPDLVVANSPQEDAPPVFLALSIDTVYAEDLENIAFLEISAQLWLGDDSQWFDNLHGVAVGIRYPEELSGLTASYNDNAFMGAPTDVLMVQRDLSALGAKRLDLAYSRKADPGVNGGGPVATVSFIISSDIIDGREEPEYDLTFSLEGVVLVDGSGDTLSYSLPGVGGVVTVINGGISTISGPRETPAEMAPVVAPNPAHDWLTVTLPTAAVEGEICLRDLAGKLHRRYPIEGQRQKTLPLQGLPAGVYLLECITTHRRTVQRILVH